MKNGFEKVGFTIELCKRAMDVYSDSSFTFYMKDGKYFCADNSNTSDIYPIGDLEDVENFLLQFVDEE